jgi:KDO2-lipid IV(A) lauroyltransferase
MRFKRKLQNVLKTFGNAIGWTFAKATMALVPRLPEHWLISIGSGMGRVFYYLVGKYRRIGLRNLRYAFGSEKSEAEIKEIFKSCMEDIGKNFMEVMHAFGLSADQIRQKIELSGREHLDKALAEGKGVIAFSAHVGNFILIGPRLIAEGYPFSVVARDPKNVRIARLFREMRERFGISSIPDKPKKDCIGQSLKCLRDNGILFLQIDQNADPSDPWVDFFGWLVPTFKGPVVFSLRTEALVLPFFMIRQPDNRLKLVIEPPISLIKAADKDEEIKLNVALLTKVTEQHIRKYPEQWWWLHRRWKKAKKAASSNDSEVAEPSYRKILSAERDASSLS